MAYATISCANDRASGGVKVTTAWNDVVAHGAAKVQIRRSVTGNSAYTVIYENAVTTVAQMAFEYLDIEPAAGVSYTYAYYALASNGVAVDTVPSATIVSQFDGIVISDDTGIWHSAFGTSESRFSLSAQKNKPVNYIITLSGKFPHRVSNARTNYWTGTCTAIWLPYHTATYNGATCVEPTFENANAYRLAFMDWLMTDTEKYLKTSDGKAMIVSVDGTPQENYNAIEGMTTVTFDWTQIGEAPGVSA